MIRFNLYRKQVGLGLVELLVSIAVGLLVLAGVFQVFISSIENRRSQEAISRVQESFRFLSNRLNIEGATSGYLGCLARTLNIEYLDNVLSNQTGVLGSSVPDLYNFDASSASGREAAGELNTDVVFFRFFSPFSMPIAQINGDTVTVANDGNNLDYVYSKFKQWDVAILTDCTYATVAMITNAPNSSNNIQFAPGVASTAAYNAGQQNLRGIGGRLVQYWGQNNVPEGEIVSRLFVGDIAAYQYSVRQSRNGVLAGQQCTRQSPRYCALYRNDDEITEGVVDFQVEYGWFKEGNVSFGDADVVSANEAWPLIDRVKLSLTLSALSDGPAAAQPNNPNVERELSQLVMLKNPIDNF